MLLLRKKLLVAFVHGQKSNSVTSSKLLLIGANGAVGGARVDVEPVRLHAGRHGREPPVKNSKLRSKGFVNGDFLQIEPVHDVPGLVRVHGAGLVGEPVHQGQVSRCVVGSEDLLADLFEVMTGVRVDVYIVRCFLEVVERGVRVGCGERVRFGPVDSVDVGVEFFHPTQHVVEGAVFHYNSYGLDWTG